MLGTIYKNGGKMNFERVSSGLFTMKFSYLNATIL